MGKLYVFSGAGLSAESGIKTFRDAGGLWSEHEILQVCDISNFAENYIKVNEFYNARRIELATVEPNKAHLAIAHASNEIEVVNITTNVDDLLERAGCKDVAHLHGNLTRVQKSYSMGDHYDNAVDFGYTAVEDKFLIEHYPVKPAVVFFGESAPEYQKLEDAMVDITSDDVIIIVGSSESVVHFSYNIAFASRQQWEQQEVNERPKMFFVNPHEIETELPQCFSKELMSATEFFTSDTFKEVVSSLK